MKEHHHPEEGLNRMNSEPLVGLTGAVGGRGRTVFAIVQRRGTAAVLIAAVAIIPAACTASSPTASRAASAATAALPPNTITMSTLAQTTAAPTVTSAPAPTQTASISSVVASASGATGAVGEAGPTTSATATSTPPNLDSSDTETALVGNCVALAKGMPTLNDPNADFTKANIDRSFAAIRAAAPSNLKAYVDFITTTEAPYFAAISKANGDFSKLMKDPALMKQMDTAFKDPKFKAATDALETWFKAGCPNG